MPATTEVVESANHILFNTNDHIEVVLTPDGVDTVIEYYVAEYQTRKSRARHMLAAITGEDGWTTFQLYELMNIFGSAFVISTDSPFIDNQIRIPLRAHLSITS